MDQLAVAPRVVLPDLGVLFAERAMRLRQLAVGHHMTQYLNFMAELVAAQHEAVAKRAVPGVSDSALAQSRDFGMPPLAAASHPREAQWHEDVSHIVDALNSVASQIAVDAALTALRGMHDTAIESLADRILMGETLDSDAAAVPIVGAALQVMFSRQAASLSPDMVAHADVTTLCPVCATRPVASVVRLGGDRNNLRYLACALCSTEWNVARIKCSACGLDKSVHYLSLQAHDEDGKRSEQQEGAAAARKAETCDECKSYLKIFYQEKDPQVEALADDLASLALDVLVDEQGYGRSGPNLLFHPGTA